MFPIEASAAQISQFTKLISNNARPVQHMGHRLLIDSASGGAATH
jgi:carbonic anhydrase